MLALLGAWAGMVPPTPGGQRLDVDTRNRALARSMPPPPPADAPAAGAGNSASLTVQLQQRQHLRRKRQQAANDSDEEHTKQRKQSPLEQQVQAIGAPAALVVVGVASVWAGLRGVIGAYQQLRRHSLRRLLHETAPGGRARAPGRRPCMHAPLTPRLCPHLGTPGAVQALPAAGRVS